MRKAAEAKGSSDEYVTASDQSAESDEYYSAHSVSPNTREQREKSFDERRYRGFEMLVRMRRTNSYCGQSTPYPKRPTCSRRNISICPEGDSSEEGEALPRTENKNEPATEDVQQIEYVVQTSQVCNVQAAEEVAEVLQTDEVAQQAECRCEPAVVYHYSHSVTNESVQTFEAEDVQQDEQVSLSVTAGDTSESGHKKLEKSTIRPPGKRQSRKKPTLYYHYILL